jgi:membrane fusion protein, multidrug efflux system
LNRGRRAFELEDGINTMTPSPATHSGQPASSVGTPADAKAKSEKNWLRTATALVLLSVIGVGVVGRWLYYRYHHVISDTAVVRGRIAQVGARINGRVAEVLVDENQRIHRGDLVARMEDQTIRAQLLHAKAENLRAQKDLDVEIANVSAERTRLTLGVTIAESQITAAEADCRTAEIEQGRMERQQARIDSIRQPLVVTAAEADLIASQLASSRVALQAAQARLQTAKLNRDSAQWAIKTLENREAHIDVLRRQVEIAAADVGAAEGELEATLLRASEDGWVSRRILEVGSSARIGDPIIALWVGEKLWVEAWFDESCLPSLEVGNHVDVRLAAYTDQVIDGRVEAIGVLSDGALFRARDAGSREPLFIEAPKCGVRIALPKNDFRIMPGLTGVVGVSSRKVVSDIDNLPDAFAERD